MNSIQIKSNGDRAKIVLLGALLIAVLVLASIYLPVGVDWRDTFRPAALMLLAGKSPFAVDIFFAAPWNLLPLIPFALAQTRAQTGR